MISRQIAIQICKYYGNYITQPQIIKQQPDILYILEKTPPLTKPNSLSNRQRSVEKMSKRSISASKYPQLRAQQKRRIVFEQLMFNQMEENLGKNIEEHVECARKFLAHVGNNKARKIVLGVEKNLHKFMRGKHDHKIRHTSQIYSSLQPDKHQLIIKQIPIFNPKLLAQQLKKHELAMPTKQEQTGALARNLVSAASRTRRAGDRTHSRQHSNIVLGDRNENMLCYSSRRGRRKGADDLFNLVIR